MTERSDVESDPMLIDIPEELEGVRIRLRPLRPGEGELLWEAIEESREHLRPWQAWPDRHKSSRHSELDVRRARLALLRRDAVPYGIWRREDGRLLGGIQLEEINWRARAFGVGYWLRASATGRGFVTEAVILVCRLAFEQLEAIRVGLLADSLNERSIAVARRLGFSPEGRIRNERLNSAGRPQDTLIFGLTREDYFGGEVNGWKDWSPLP
ncbi:MAG TPA: GNAT family protein [Pyrinomonadaceae bacterium]|jgi:RimJ/RimL family protein N-acetyltransferase